MTEFIFHPDTKKALSALKKSLPHALLLTGERGVGLRTTAKYIADSELSIELSAENQETALISVEMIRRLYEQTRAKQTAAKIILIDDADRMSNSAQAAFLKLLEEPNEHIHFILTSHFPQAIVPTIHSRVQHVIIHPVTRKQTETFLATIRDPKKKAQLLFIAEGLPAELHRLVNNDAYFKERALLMSNARQFLQGNVYERMVLAQSYKANRDRAITLCESAIQILRRSLSKQPQPSTVAQLERLLDVREKLAMNANIGLQLARFVLQ